jgi:hypothetical protein
MQKKLERVAAGHGIVLLPLSPAAGHPPVADRS